ncbi:MBL fold metallo-hydrolase [Alphaproteobacteria bacterium KMM 3653]|uniref:MBL fold metallo-hydrolase n=1 Tax=Harenicola maris TaxID=2841044 RepID=A0AAP2CMG9_9RHOB|nr:MBL fold metallo-hydrolase [Harenicola maris]
MEDVTPKEPVLLEPGLRRILAPNPSPMTFTGTNTYLLGERELAVIDPGPALPAHLEAILAAVQPGQRITHILLTHSHLDHSPLARLVSQETGAPSYAFGDHLKGRSPVMEALAESGLAGGGEGIDRDFAPDHLLEDGALVEGDGWALRALWTPGHIANHLSFVWQDAVFTGDHVMGWASSMVSPPDGDLTAFMHSCRRMQEVPARVFYPGHGDPVSDPAARLQWLIDHRMSREAQILEALAHGPAAAPALAERIYTEVNPALLPAATRNVLAHLIDLHSRRKVSAEGPLSADVKFIRS